jgi:glycosyltransferase involved in cell wall biosynthesis
VVSIVIVARDLKDKRLKECMDSITTQTYKDIETHIMTGGSILDARKRGVQTATGEYICFVDSDQVLPKELIATCIYQCEAYGCDGVTWTERALNPSTFCEKVIDYDKELFHFAQDDDPIYGAAEPRFFKSCFVDNLDWDKLPPVTFELSMINKQIQDMGAKIKFVNFAVYHHEPSSFRELAGKFFRYGYYYIPSLKYNKELVLNHSKPRRVYFTKRALRKPLLYAGLWYHYFVKAVSALGGAIWYLLSAVGRVKTQAI